MKFKSTVRSLAIAALLSSIGIIIPMFSPLKFYIEPMSFTLASHVPIFLAMFISPFTAAAVAVVTAFGFLFSGFPIHVFFRALTHLIFASAGSYAFRKWPDAPGSLTKMLPIALLIAMVHAVCEVLVIIPFFFGTEISQGKGFFTYVVLLVGAGTVVHSMVDCFIAMVIWKPLKRFKAG